MFVSEFITRSPVAPASVLPDCWSRRWFSLRGDLPQDSTTPVQRISAGRLQRCLWRICDRSTLLGASRPLPPIHIRPFASTEIQALPAEPRSFPCLTIHFADKKIARFLCC